MRRLHWEKQKQILSMFVEGNSIRSIERVTGIHRDTILRLLINIGVHCRHFWDISIRNLNCAFLQMDELWTFVKKKEHHLSASESNDPHIGSQYVYVALDGPSRFVITTVTGKRTFETTLLFMEELKTRLNLGNRPQFSSDGYKPYVTAVEKVFGDDVDFVQTVKVDENGEILSDDAEEKKVASLEYRVVTGKPNLDKASTAYIERMNLSFRSELRRFTRKSMGYSKKIENLRHALDLYIFYYNYIRIHSTLRVTPAMELGITTFAWSWDSLHEWRSENHKQDDLPVNVGNIS